MLILASASPRRRDLLRQIQIPCRVHPAAIDEGRREGEQPIAYVGRLAREKAEAMGAHFPGEIILAADTTVDLCGRILNKPESLLAAREMLQSLSGNTHEVHTGIAMHHAGGTRVHVETTAVRFTSIPEDELAIYLASGDSLDKAGAYGIQGYAARWVERIEGDYFNVMGLPLAATIRLLRLTGALSG